MGKQWKQWQTLFFRLQNHHRWWLQPWNWKTFALWKKSYDQPASAAAKLHQSWRPPGSSIPGILQARTLEWVAISFSNAWKWKVKVKSLSRVWLLATPWTADYQAPLSMGFSRQEYWSGFIAFSVGSPYRNQNTRELAKSRPWISTESPEIKACTCGQLICNKVGDNIQWREDR